MLRKNIVAIIPARVNSKRIPGKNYKKVNGKPKVNFNKGLDLAIGWFKEFKGYFRHDIYHV